MGWEALTALATLAMALLLLAIAAMMAAFLKELRRVMADVSRATQLLEQDGRPALLSARQAAEDASRVAATVRSEIDGLVGTSRDLRTQVTAATNAVADRVRDLEVVLDILQEEVEDTALDIASALRATRRGSSVVRAIKRAVLGRGR